MQSPKLRSLSTRRRALQAATVGILASSGLWSCAQEAPAESFVQPNVMAKADLQGTFYYIQTVTDSPPTNGAMFIGQSSSLLQIRFDVEQNFLYARRAYPQIANSEDDAVAAGPNYLGEPLAAWAIQEQFDIIRQYNSTTGEQTNQIVESTQRPWEQRDFIRVDWSRNLITDYVGLQLDLFFSDGQPTVEPVSFWQSDPTQPNAMHIEHLTAQEGGLPAGTMSYFDITDEMIITPEQLTVAGQTYPKCFFYYELDDCASQLISVKHSFAKMDPAHTYEPRAWDGQQMNLFGVWDVGLRRMSYNTNYGVTLTGVSQTAARFDIWDQAYDTQGNLIPPSQRTLIKIPYYAEGSRPITYEGDPRFPDGMQDSIYPPELWSDFTTIIGQWDAAMQVAVQDLTGKPAPHSIFVPCHNPVWIQSVNGEPADDPACQQNLVPTLDSNGNVIPDKQGNPILRARQADPRHSCVFWVDQMQAAGPLGYGPPLYNELTGETISGQAYIYGAALLTYATRSRDLLLLTNGDISEEGYVTGANVAAWVAKQSQGSSLAPGMQSTAGSQTFTQAQVNAMANAMNFNYAAGLTPANGFPGLDLSNTTNLLTSMGTRMESLYQGYWAQGVPARDTMLAQLVGSPVEQQMVTQESMAVAGISPLYTFQQLAPAQQAQVSPLTYEPIEAQLAQLRMGAEIRSVDFYDGFSDNGMSGRQCYYLQQFYNNVNCTTAVAANNAALAAGTPMPYPLQPFAENIYTDLENTIFTAVTLHEVGHNMGCRHNFRASYDAMNYQPTLTTDANGQMVQGYWNIRENALTQPPGPGMSPSDGQLHPRYVNKPGGALTPYEINSREQEYQYTSVMDYGSEFYSDLHGLGLYDKALIKFSYADTVEVFTDAKANAVDTFAAMSSEQQDYGLPSPLGAGAILSATPYQTFPTLFNTGWQGIYLRADVPYSSVGFVQNPDGNTILEDNLERPVVPYYFCSDEFVGNLTCQRFDSGADPYEQSFDLISRYTNFYLYNDFKRDKLSFYTSLGYKERIMGRYFDMLREQLTWYTLFRTLFAYSLGIDSQLGSGVPPNQDGQEEASFFSAEDGWGPFTVAVTNGFDLLGNVLTTPEAGLFYQNAPPTVSGDTPLWVQYNDTVPSPLISGNGIQSVGLIDGKYSTVTWDFTDCGYYWFDLCQVRIGYLIDKELALDELTQSTAYFTGFDTSTDVREYSIGYIIPFQAQIEEKLGALLSNDYQSFNPFFASTGTGPGGTTYAPVQRSWALDNPTQQTSTTDPNTGLISLSPTSGAEPFTLQLYANTYSLAGFPTTFDPNFINTTQVFVVGNGEAPVSDTLLTDPTLEGTFWTSNPAQLVANGGTVEWFEVTDNPDDGQGSGKTYGAHSVTTQKIQVPDPTSSTGSTTTVALRTDTGVRMLQQLQSYENAYNTAWTTLQGTPNNATAQTNEAYTQTNYHNFIDNVEMMRTLQSMYGYVPATEPNNPTYSRNVHGSHKVSEVR